MEQREFETLATQGTEQIMRAMGYGSRETGKLVTDIFASSHNTLQQGFVRDVVHPIMKYLAETKWVDARNKGAQEYARRVVAATEDLRLPFI